MNMRDICQRELVSISAAASVQEAARAMRQNHVGALAVTDPYEPGRVVGMLTDRDIVVRMLAEGDSSGDRPVGALCGTELTSVRSTASVHEALKAMRSAGVRRLLVTDDDRSIVGLVSMDDLIDAIAMQFEDLAGALRSGIARESASPQEHRALHMARIED